MLTFLGFLITLFTAVLAVLLASDARKKSRSALRGMTIHAEELLALADRVSRLATYTEKIGDQGLETRRANNATVSQSNGLVVEVRVIKEAVRVLQKQIREIAGMKTYPRDRLN